MCTFRENKRGNKRYQPMRPTDSDPPLRANNDHGRLIRREEERTQSLPRVTSKSGSDTTRPCSGLIQNGWQCVEQLREEKLSQRNGGGGGCAAVGHAIDWCQLDIPRKAANTAVDPVNAPGRLPRQNRSRVIFSSVQFSALDR